MSDHFGALEFPVQVPGINDSVQDPALDCIGGYLMACLNDQLGPSWQAVNPGRKFVESFATNAANDLFNERDLPGLFLYRSISYDEQYTDDWTMTSTDVAVTWVPQNADQAKRALRSTGVNGLSKVITRALALGRSPAWVDPADTDPEAEVLGSVLVDRARLIRMPYVISSKNDRVTIEKGMEYSTYPAFTVMVKVQEITEWDQSFDSLVMADRAPTELNETVTSGNYSISALIPTT